VAVAGGWHRQLCEVLMRRNPATYHRVEIWTLRIGLLFIWLGITGNHHTWVSTLGFGLLVVSIIVTIAKFVQGRRSRTGTRDD
jgi:hypothetical protein